MANCERRAGSDSRQDLERRESLRRNGRQGSPRASLAFSALNATDWAGEKLGRLLSRFTAKVSKAELRNEHEPEVKTRTSRVRPAIIGQVLLALACLSAKPCLGGTIYNNLGPNNSFLINYEYDTGVTYLATNFTATDGGRLDSILVPLFSLTAPVTITLYEDSNGMPGALLESWAATVPGIPAELATLMSVLHPSMFAGTTYWLVIAQAKGFEVSWYQNNQTATGGIWEGGNLTQMLQFLPGNPMPALEVLSVEEPGPGCKSTYKSGSGPSFLQFCVTANGNMTVFQSPAGTLHFMNNDRAEGYGFCDVNRETAYFDYAAGGDSANWDAPVVNQPNGAEHVSAGNLPHDGGWGIHSYAVLHSRQRRPQRQRLDEPHEQYGVRPEDLLVAVREHAGQCDGPGHGGELCRPRLRERVGMGIRPAGLGRDALGGADERYASGSRVRGG